MILVQLRQTSRAPHQHTHMRCVRSSIFTCAVLGAKQNTCRVEVGWNFWHLRDSNSRPFGRAPEARALDRSAKVPGVVDDSGSFPAIMLHRRMIGIRRSEVLVPSPGCQVRRLPSLPFRNMMHFASQRGRQGSFVVGAADCAASFTQSALLLQMHLRSAMHLHQRARQPVG